MLCRFQKSKRKILKVGFNLFIESIFSKDCNNDWNTEFCAVKCVNQSETEDSDFASLLYKIPEFNESDPLANTVLSDKLCTETRSPAKEYFK